MGLGHRRDVPGRSGRGRGKVYDLRFAAYSLLNIIMVQKTGYEMDKAELGTQIA